MALDVDDVGGRLASQRLVKALNGRRGVLIGLAGLSFTGVENLGIKIQNEKPVNDKRFLNIYYLEDPWDIFGLGSDDVTLSHGSDVEHFAVKNKEGEN